MYEFDIFNTENYFSDYARNKYEQLYNEIRNQPEDYILNVDETKYFDYSTIAVLSDTPVVYFPRMDTLTFMKVGYILCATNGRI